MPHVGGESPSGDRPRVNPSENKKGNGKARGGDPRKVQALRTSVGDGKYRVESRKVADRIVRDAVREIRNRLR